MLKQRPFWLLFIGHWWSQGLKQAWPPLAGLGQFLKCARSLEHHLSGWAVTAPASFRPVSTSGIPCLCLRCLADSMQCPILTFHVILNVQLTSECPANSNGSRDLLTILYLEYIQPHSPRLRKTNLIIQTPSSNFQYQKLFFYSFCTGHHFHSSFVWTLLLRQEKPLCLKDKYLLWQV